MKQLPLPFAVKWTSEYKWKHFIDYINTQTESSYSGDSRDGYYGMKMYNDELIVICECAETLGSNVTIMTLDEVFDIIGHPTIEMVTDYNGDEQVKDLCVQIHDDSRNHAGEWALKEECRWCDYNQGYGLCDDTYYVRGGCYVLAETEDDYDIAWSDVTDEYLDTDHSNVYYGYVSNNRGGTYETWFYCYNPIELDGHYYYDGDAARGDGYMWSERCDEWIHQDDWCDEDHEYQDEEDEDNANNARYQSLPRQTRFDSSAKFTIGFEIEKEDYDKASYDYDSLYQSTGWAKEDDGSLSDSSGYELVTPAFDLFDNKLDDEINNSRELRDLINASHSSKCGGHINLGSTLYTTEQLFEGISGFFPLFYSIYEHRIEQNYSKAKKKHQYYNRDKYSSIFIKPHVVEIRIPSAVKDVTNLLWRRDLMRIITENINKSEMQVLRMLLNSKSKLHIHLRKIFSVDKMIEKIELFVKYSEEFNNVKLPKVNTSNLQKTDKLGA
jgi:hypothetical protein